MHIDYATPPEPQPRRDPPVATLAEASIDAARVSSEGANTPRLRSSAPLEELTRQPHEAAGGCCHCGNDCSGR
ncbi:hypothetical protein [Phytopseudomonas dryadis]|uniref:hypothetical protein n=1 Tax=Phytopseudomonas dryadis TaxID=2487520 RepID=UPI0010385DB9|nr:hypothetical protein [Pseudomonas dryadis]